MYLVHDFDLALAPYSALVAVNVGLFHLTLQARPTGGATRLIIHKSRTCQASEITITGS